MIKQVDVGTLLALRGSSVRKLLASPRSFRSTELEKFAVGQYTVVIKDFPVLPSYILEVNHGEPAARLPWIEVAVGTKA